MNPYPVALQSTVALPHSDSVLLFTAVGIQQSAGSDKAINPGATRLGLR